jgi:hypothetical protein
VSEERIAATSRRDERLSVEGKKAEKKSQVCLLCGESSRATGESSEDTSDSFFHVFYDKIVEFI